MSGCNKSKCPCRIWSNCSQYIDTTTQIYRLKQKKYNKIIEEWYINNFKIDYELPSSIPNG